MKILQSHDNSLDVCRSFLIVSMVFTHVFEMFYLPDYNRRLTYFVTIGFVFLSGFTTGAIYYERICINSKLYFKTLTIRALKLLMMFVACNLFILTISDSRFIFFNQLSISEIFISIFLGTHQTLFGFDILVPLALTSFFSWFVLKFLNKHISSAIIFIFLSFIWISEQTNILDYYGVKLLFTGLVGCLTGRFLNRLNWDNTLRILSKNYTTIP